MSALASDVFISIGVPTYRRTTYIRQALESCLGQSYPHFEVIVNDDTEDDAIGSIVSSLKSNKIRYVKNPSPIGLNHKLNAFLDQARGEWMLILCDDDSLEPGYLEAVARLAREHPGAALIRTRYRLVDARGRLLRLDHALPPEVTPFEFLDLIFLPEKQGFKMNVSGVLFPRKRLKEAGGFSYFHKTWHVDRLAWAQLASQGPCLCTPEALCSIRLHGASITGSLDPHYEKAIESTLRMKAAMEGLLRDLRSRARAESDRTHLASAEKHLKAYVQRHLTRAFDQGIMAVLRSTNGHTCGDRLRKIYGQMQDLKLPAFPSARLYAFLAKTPPGFRRPLLDLLQIYKIRKWQS